ncbi:tetrapyrrole-binding protein, chloroplastic [Arachis ipaensis]|uniref:tetrapyrrole-binding protein, chloroplastic n=1 Tax=Arachis ipaensis TaxID=130454 RepID=UPI000A2B5883|nr:tetrapyrrole-binding protein, chloroplastic [Arachis ipaensis]
MATNSLHCSIQQHHNHHFHIKFQPPTTISASQLFLKPSNITNNITLSHSSSGSSSFSCVTFSLSQATSTTPSSTSQESVSFEVLKQHLTAEEYQKADEETRRLLIVLAGEAAQKRGYVFFSEVQFISESDLKTIDELWRVHSDNKFGYSVQKKIFEKSNEDFTKFFIKVGWMKKLDTEMEQCNYEIVGPGEDEEEAGGAMNADVAEVANALANPHPFQEPSFMRSLDLEAMHAPEFPQYMNPAPPVVADGEFTVGMEFSSREAVIKAIKDYTIRIGVDYWVYESESTTFYAKCTEYGMVVTG